MLKIMNIHVKGMISACHKILDYLKNSKVSYNELIRK